MRRLPTKQTNESHNDDPALRLLRTLADIITRCRKPQDDMPKVQLYTNSPLNSPHNPQPCPQSSAAPHSAHLALSAPPASTPAPRTPHPTPAAKRTRAPSRRVPNATPSSTYANLHLSPPHSTSLLDEAGVAAAVEAVAATVVASMDPSKNKSTEQEQKANHTDAHMHTHTLFVLHA